MTGIWTGTVTQPGAGSDVGTATITVDPDGTFKAEVSTTPKTSFWGKAVDSETGLTISGDGYIGDQIGQFPLNYFKFAGSGTSATNTFHLSPKNPDGSAFRDWTVIASHP